jgi:trigger factor
VVVKAEKEVLERNKVKIRIEVPAEEIDRAINRAFRDIAREVFVPGFRKGRVPRRVLQARLGMEPVYEEVKQSNLPRYYSEALEQLDLEPIDEPEIDVETIEIEEGKPLVFDATVEVKPRVELEDYKGVEVEKPDLEVKEEEVQKALDALREKFARLEEASGKVLAEGDYAIIDYHGTVNGEPFEGGEAKDFMLEVGSENIWPEFNRELLGKRKGDILDVKVKMPERLPRGELAGKIASFKVIVKEVKVKKFPEADDEFAKEASRFDTIEELKADLREKIAEAKRREAEDSVRREVLEKLAARIDVEIPEKMVQDYVRQRREDLEAGLAGRGISLDSYLKAVDYTEQRMEDEFAEEARRLIRNELVLEAVARAEGMEVTDEELEEELRRRAEILSLPPQEYRRLVEERGRLEDIRRDLLHVKALKFLGEHAVFAGEGPEEKDEGGNAADETSGEETEDGGRSSGEGEVGEKG